MDTHRSVVCTRTLHGVTKTKAKVESRSMGGKLYLWFDKGYESRDCTGQCQLDLKVYTEIDMRILTNT